MKKLSKNTIKSKEKLFEKFTIPRTLKNIVLYFQTYVNFIKKKK